LDEEAEIKKKNNLNLNLKAVPFYRSGRPQSDPLLRQRVFLLASVQTGSEARPASYTMGNGGPFPGGKARPGRDADHSPPSTAVVKN
jgi:hypothetical protein